MLSWFMDIKIIPCYAIMDGQDILQSMYPEYGELDMQLEQIHENRYNQQHYQPEWIYRQRKCFILCS